MSELAEKIEDINKWLKRDYGCHTDGRQWFRVVFAYDQLEKRIMTHTDEGLQLIHPEIRLVPKYRHYIPHSHYILERIVTILPGVETDLVEREPYEVVYTFMDKNSNYLPPLYAVCKFILDTLYENKRVGIKKYTNPEDLKSEEEKHLEMMKYLWDDVDSDPDLISFGRGVAVPTTYERTKNGNFN